MLRRAFSQALKPAVPKSVFFSGARFSSHHHGIAASYWQRHVGPDAPETQEMLKVIGCNSIADLMNSVIPAEIRRPEWEFVPEKSEGDALNDLRALMGRNKVLKSCIGQGYYEPVIPPVIIRNVLENPRWYTPYTPYQAEIAQGRLESLLNYQTMVTELTGVPFANASLLDEACSAFEAVHLAWSHHRKKRSTVFVANTVLPASIAMIKTRAAVLGIKVVVDDIKNFNPSAPENAGLVVQTPDANGQIHDYTELFSASKAKGVVCICGTDLMASTVIKSVGEMGADVAYGSAQRFGVPLGYGGPHASFFAVQDDFKRVMPGRLIGISKDAEGNQALRMALQTREQHIKREKATSNICTAQALLANMAAMYAIYHGPDGLTNIANGIHERAKILAVGFASAGHKVNNTVYFDTITVTLKGDAGSKPAQKYAAACVENGINIHVVNDTTVSIAVDEATNDKHLAALLQAAGLNNPVVSSLRSVAAAQNVLGSTSRTSKFMQQAIFNTWRSETEMMRYCNRLQRKDYGLTDGMVPLGSCTMKLNAAATMIPMSWPEVGNIHPHVPVDQVAGYQAMFVTLKNRLKAVTGFAACSLQPNSGAQGEYAGLRTIRAYHDSRGDTHRNICLLPVSAHGTNPATAALCGYTGVTVKCLPDGRIDWDDLVAKCEEHSKNLAAIMITYPSTYGVFDVDVKRITQKVHDHGGQVYIDGANLNAMVGYTGPGFIGGDVCHINMHKTFAIPHGGGGPGMGPICVREHLAPFLPNSTFGPAGEGGSNSFGTVSQAPFGSASILNISFMEMIMLGSEGLKRCTEYALLNANYMMTRLSEHYPILFRGATGRCAHEFILDLRPFKISAGIEAEDVAKRLMDYGFHAPTLAFPVPGTLMIEPTESEPKTELDRLVDALISIRAEIKEIEEGKYPKDNNVLVNSPHTCTLVCSDKWDKPYSREKAAYPTPFQREYKFWPSVARIDGAYGDRNLMCSCSQ